MNVLQIRIDLSKLYPEIRELNAKMRQPQSLKKAAIYGCNEIQIMLSNA